MIEAIQQLYFAPNVLDFLSTNLIYPFDYWHIIHFISGMILYYILKEEGYKKAFLILVIFEVFEFYLYTIGLARIETTLNRLLDIATGYLGYWVIKKKR